MILWLGYGLKSCVIKQPVQFLFPKWLMAKVKHAAKYLKVKNYIFEPSPMSRDIKYLFYIWYELNSISNQV
jgi:hypothetical protein